MEEKTAVDIRVLSHEQLARENMVMEIVLKHAKVDYLTSKIKNQKQVFETIEMLKEVLVPRLMCGIVGEMFGGGADGE